MKAKRNLIQIWLLCATIMLAPQLTQAQGTMTYLSSLSPTPTGSVLVGSDSWLALQFTTGNNASGYSLDSIQLGMADASGSPTNFTVMILPILGATQGTNPISLGTLDGSLDPATAGIYTFTSVSNLMLAPYRRYYIALTAGTTIANGAFSLSESTFPPNSMGEWSAGNGVLQSATGLFGWSQTPYLGIAQFAINATAIPEPGVLGLLSLGGLAFLWHHRKEVTAR